jgi:hypothetical protein
VSVFLRRGLRGICCLIMAAALTAAMNAGAGSPPLTADGVAPIASTSGYSINLNALDDWSIPKISTSPSGERYLGDFTNELRR